MHAIQTGLAHGLSTRLDPPFGTSSGVVSQQQMLVVPEPSCMQQEIVLVVCSAHLHQALIWLFCAWCTHAISAVFACICIRSTFLRRDIAAHTCNKRALPMLHLNCRLTRMGRPWHVNGVHGILRPFTGGRENDITLFPATQG